MNQPTKKRVFFDKTTGDVFFEVNMQSDYPLENDILSFNPLRERHSSTFDVVELEFDQYAQDFIECVGYRVNVETKTLEFSYPDPNEPNLEQPYQAPLSEKVKKLELAQSVTDTTLLELMESLLQ